MAVQWPPTYMKQLLDWLANPGMYMYGRWDTPASAMEGGVDLPSAGGTPVYALSDGVIVGAGNFWHSSNLYTPGSGPPGYGVVTVRTNVPGYGTQDLYYQHINLNPSIVACQGSACQGQVVHKGDLLGYINPNVNEVEMGFNANWGGVWGESHPGTWATDPRPMLAALLQQPPPASVGGMAVDFTGIPQGSNSTLGFDPGSILDPIIGPFEQGLVKGLEIAGIGLIAAIMIYFGIVLLTGKDLGDAEKSIAGKEQALEKVAAMAAM